MGQKFTKTSFEREWSRVVKDTECNFFVKGDDKKFIDEVVDSIEKWKKIKNRGEVKYKIRNKKFQGRAVRGVVMITSRSKREIWLGKGAITNALFPRKKEVPEYVKNKKMALMAMRQIIEPQIIQYRRSVLRQVDGKKAGGVKCAITGKPISAGSFHIDHKYPFKNIVEEWCREMRVDLENLDVYCRGTKCYFKNTDLAESFFDYHMINATLQVLVAEENLKKGSKYYG